jgi:hypothetical protein
MPVIQQLAIAMFQFGHFGNAALVESVAQWAGVAARHVVKCTHWVMIMFSDLHGEAVRWPTTAEKEEAKEWVEAALCVA